MPSGTPVRVREGVPPYAVDFAEELVFVKIIVLLTSLTGRLLGPRPAFEPVTGVACKAHKTQVNQACRLLGALWTPPGRLQVDFGYSWGRPERFFGAPCSSWGCLLKYF